MGELLRLLNGPCREIAALVSTEMDAELPRSQRWAVRLHLLYCGACRSYRRHLHLLRQLLRLLAEQVHSVAPPAPAPAEAGGQAHSAPTLSAEARQRIKRALSNL